MFRVLLLDVVAIKEKRKVTEFISALRKTVTLQGVGQPG